VNFFKKKIINFYFLLLFNYLKLILNIYFNIFSYIKYSFSKLYNISINTSLINFLILLNNFFFNLFKLKILFKKFN
jgi:hypothetical protein